MYDNVAPVITVDDLEPFCSINNVTCDAQVTIPFLATDLCTPNDLEVKVFLDAFVVDANGDGVITTSEFVRTGELTVTGAGGSYQIAGRFPIGRHAIEIHAKDGCGNATAVVVVFDVIDCKAPAPVCINALTVGLMPLEPGTDADGDGDEDEGAMAIWASDFLASPISDCTGPIKYAIYRAADVIAYEAANGQGSFIPNPQDTGLVLTCDDDNATVVYIYAIDASTDGVKDFDFCETLVLVQDNMGLCDGEGGEGSLAGAIKTEDNVAVQGVQVALSGSMSMQSTTPTDGLFRFTGLELGQDYTVTPQLDANPKNGVSTFDLVLISKHILGTQVLDSPYKQIAADANNSKTITTLDLIQLRRLILGTITELPGNTSWRFVDASYQFPNSLNPWAATFPEVKNVNDLPTVAPEAVFVAIKVGDVNASAKANSLASADVRSKGTFSFEVADAKLSAGSVYTVDFTAAELSRIAGFQGTLTLSGAELVDVQYGVAGEENFAVHGNDVTFSWNGEAATNDVLFSLVVRASSDAQLSEVLGVSNRITTAEAYTTSGEVQTVAINFSTGAVVGAGFEVAQNQPNPFAAETLINFTLPTAGEVSLTIQDVTGRTLVVKRGEYAAGANQITVTSRELGATGVLTYTLTAGEFTATKKMVAVK